MSKGLLLRARGFQDQRWDLPGRGRPTYREMLQAGVQQPESRGGDAPDGQGGKRSMLTEHPYSSSAYSYM